MVIVAKQRRISCAVVGDEMIGKSCFIKSFLGEEFSEKYVATTSEVYNGHAIVGGERFNIEISDIANERDSEMTYSSAVQECDVLIVCYSITDPDSFDNVRTSWIPELQTLKRRSRIILVGLQSDLRSSNSDCVSLKEGQYLCREIQADGFFECSSLRGVGIKPVFTSAVEITVRNRKKKLNFIKKALGR